MASLTLWQDDVAWDLPGFRHLTGSGFEGEILNPQFAENPM